MKLQHFLLLSLFAIGLMGCPPKPFDKPGPPAGSFVFGGEGSESGNQLLELPDGSILIVGAAKLDGNEDYDVQLIKVNPDGSEAWTRNFRNKEKEETGNSIIATASGYTIAGFSRTDLNSPNRLLIIELDQDFEVVREQEIASSAFATRNSHLAAFYQLADGSYLAALSLEATPIIVKINSDLQAESLQSYPSGGYTYKTQYITQMQDGGFMMGVTDLDSFSFNRVPYIIKLDENGTSQWSRPVDSLDLNNIFNASVFGIATRPNGNILLTMYDGRSDQIIFELDTVGDAIDRTNLPFEPQYPHLIPLADGNVVLAGRNNFVYNNVAVGINFEFAELDTNNQFTFTDDIGGPQEETINDMIVLSDGRIAAVGSTLSFGKGVSDIFLVLYNR